MDDPKPPSIRFGPFDVNELLQDQLKDPFLTEVRRKLNERVHGLEIDDNLLLIRITDKVINISVPHSLNRTNRVHQPLLPVGP